MRRTSTPFRGSSLPFTVLFLLAAPLFAQVPVTVTNNGGGQAAGSLGAAVTTLNNSGAGSITVTGVGPITLTLPLDPLSVSVTFLGGPLRAVGQDDAQSTFLFAQDLVLGNGLLLNLSNNGGLASGLDVAVTVQDWIQDLDSSAGIFGGRGASVTTTGGSGVTGGDGGDASVTVGSWGMNNGQSAVIQAGGGGDVTDMFGSNDSGGDGGAASLAADSMSVSATDFDVRGGFGGTVYDLLGGGSTGGNGGSASVSIGDFTLAGSSQSRFLGGNGGGGKKGGDGGQASATFGSFHVASANWSLEGGKGGAGDGDTGGSGGDAYVTFGDLTVDTTSNFTVRGGNGDGGPLGAGGGGSAQMAGGSATLSGSFSNIQILGGNGGSPASSLIPFAGGSGGDASMTMTSLVTNTGAILDVRGGDGGSGNNTIMGGAGGAGGYTSLNLGFFSMGTSVQWTFQGGNGGDGGQGSSGDGGDGGDGGGLVVTLGSLPMNINSNLNLYGGQGGDGGASSGGAGGEGGDGGDVTLTASSVTLAVSTSIGVNGGAGGSGNGSPDGASGNAWVSFGTLDGAGNVQVSGGSATLQVGSGNYSGILSGTMALEKTGAGVLTLTGNHTYSGGTTVALGDLLVSGRLGMGLISNDAYLYFQDTATAAGNTIVNDQNVSFQDDSTAADASVTNNGNLYFTDSATAANSTIVNNGSLQFADGSSAGAATVTVNNGATAEFHDTSTGGTSRFIVDGGGAFDLSSHTGGIAVGSIEGGGAFLLGSNPFSVGFNDLSTTVSGTISGSGLLRKYGNGTLTLTGSNSYGGGTLIAEGVLEAGDPLALGSGSVIVGSGAVPQGGTLAISGGPITLAIVGDYAQNTNGILQLELGGSNAGLSDAVDVSGYVSILGGTLSLMDMGALTTPTVGQSVTLITASSVSGQFDLVTQTLSVGRLLPTYFSDRVELLSIVESFGDAALTPNQAAIAGVLDGSYGDVRIHDLVEGIGVLSDPELRGSYDRLSPSSLTSFYQVGFAGARSRAFQVSERLAALRHGPGIPGASARMGGLLFLRGLDVPELSPSHRRSDPSSQEMGFFLLGDGGVLNVSGDGNAAGYQAASFGVGGAGIDLRFADGLTGGLLLGYGHSDITTDDGGMLAADGGQVGLYGSFAKKGLYFQGYLEGGFNSYSTTRSGEGGLAEGKTNGTQFGGELGAGYEHPMGRARVGPFASLRYVRVDLGAFEEKGSLAPLSFPAQGRSSLAGTVGLAFAADLGMGKDALLTPGLRFAWKNEFEADPDALTAAFATGDAFTVAGPALGAGGFLIGASLEATLPGNLGLFAHYQGELGREGLDSQRFGAGTRLGF